MLKKIKSISQIGVFESFSGTTNEFWKFTGFFWENTYWKTTLARILNSLWDDDCTQLNELKTINSSAPWTPQKIEIKWFDEVTNSEYLIEYSDWADKWVNNRLKWNVYVFDNDFIHKHLITWVDVTHWNRENFTDFILWKQAVKSITEIEILKKKFALLKWELPKFIPPYMSREKDWTKIKAFLDLKITETSETIQKKVDENKVNIKNLSSSNIIAKIIDLKDFSPKFLIDLNNIVGKINLVNKKDFKSVTWATLQNIKDHITRNTDNWKNIDGWIKSWFIEHKNWDNCPFCWQDITTNSLLDDFWRFFNQAYSAYAEGIIRDLNTHCQTLYNDVVPDVYNYLNLLTVRLWKYSKFDDRITISSKIIDDTNELRLLEQSFIKEYNEEKNRIKSYCDSKRQAPHKDIDDIEVSEDIIEKYWELVKKAEEIYTELLPNIKLAKQLKEYHAELSKKWTWKEELKKLQEEAVKLDMSIARIQQETQCGIYSWKIKEVHELYSTINSKIQALEAAQTLYLAQYFTEIDTIYKKFWNKNFELTKKEWPKKWNRKTYFLSITYKGKEISHTDFPKLLSESEKRSLAFSVFLARIQKLSNAEKEKAIIILDDPVVSFDQTRIDATVNYLKVFITPIVKQLIVLTHYQNFMWAIQQQYKSELGSFYYEIEKWWLYSVRDKKFFLRTLESIHFNSLSEFAKWNTNNIDPWLPRVYIEKYIDFRFQKQILDAWLSLSNKLVDKIDILPLDDIKKKELQTFRVEFNTWHHDFTNPSELENFRTSVNNLLNTLFST